MKAKFIPEQKKAKPPLKSMDVVKNKLKVSGACLMEIFSFFEILDL